MKRSLDTEESSIINEIPDDINDSNTFERTVNPDPLESANTSRSSPLEIILSKIFSELPLAWG